MYILLLAKMLTAMLQLLAPQSWIQTIVLRGMVFTAVISSVSYIFGSVLTQK